MLAWLWRWLTGACKHQYELVSQQNVVDQRYDSKTHLPIGDARPTGTKFILKCRHCGKMKSEIL